MPKFTGKGIFETTPATISNGQYVDLHLSDKGYTIVVNPDGTPISGGGGGGGYQYQEDAAHVSGDYGTMLLAVRNDAGSALAGTTGDYIPLSTDASGALRTTGGGASVVDQSTFTPATTSGNILMGVFQATPNTIADGKSAALLIDANRNLSVVLGTAIAGEDLVNDALQTVYKPLASGSYAPSLYAPMTQVTKANLKASAGNVFSIYITNANAAVRYFQLHNKASAPAGTDVPIYSFPVPAGTANNPGVLVLDNAFFTQAGKYFGTGIGWAISTTYGSFTDTATNTEHVAAIHYI